MGAAVWDKVLQTIVDSYVSYPIILLLLYAWITERTDRKLIQEKYEKLAERVVKGLADATTATTAAISGQQSMQMVLMTLKDLLLSRGQDDRS